MHHRLTPALPGIRAVPCRQWLLAALLTILLTACGGPTPAVTAPDVDTDTGAAALSGSTDWAALPQSRTPEGYQVLGSADAPVTITYYSDFFCTTCAFHVVETEPQIIQSYIATGKARLVYRHLFQIGEQSALTAEASECAADQGAFWPMRYALYVRQGELYGTADLPATLQQIGGDLGLDAERLGACVRERTHRDAVEADFRAAQQSGVQSRPVFDIGERRLVGAQQLDQFQQAIDAALPPAQ